MNNTRSLARRAALAAAVAVSALSLAACGGESGNSSDAAPTVSAEADGQGRHNEADVAFAQGMIPHHRQAVAMSRMAAGHTSSSEVEELARKIEKAQDPEIDTMSGWLGAWGERVPEGMDGMDEEAHGMDHGDASSMPGMMDDRQMDELDGASGKAFDTMFLTMMIQHHEGAVEMAKTEKRQGSYGPAKSLADDIIEAQTAEITQM
ncbi:DUF305 domain-containing protein, partial [Streptomyces sp. GC420]|uniref:DUF305 domain-containing protein n=1 Tax=Streptomyces sp. GC420 TaxID=2697568 RepID=UPI001414FB5C